jgi:hypothetical protein
MLAIDGARSVPRVAGDDMGDKSPKSKTKGKKQAATKSAHDKVAHDEKHAHPAPTTARKGG